MRAAIYVRVSTPDQRVESQLYDLRELAAQRGVAIKRVQRRDRNLDVNDRLRRETCNRGRSVMFNPRGEWTQGRRNSVTLLDKCQGQRASYRTMSNVVIVCIVVLLDDVWKS